MAGPTLAKIKVHIILITNWRLLRVYLDKQPPQNLVHIVRLSITQLGVLVKHFQKVGFQVASLVQDHLRACFYLLVVPMLEV